MLLALIFLFPLPNLLSAFRSVVTVLVVLLDQVCAAGKQSFPGCCSPITAKATACFPMWFFWKFLTERGFSGHGPPCHGPHIGNGEPKAWWVRSEVLRVPLVRVPIQFLKSALVCHISYAKLIFRVSFVCGILLSFDKCCYISMSRILSFCRSCLAFVHAYICVGWLLYEIIRS